MIGQRFGRWTVVGVLDQRDCGLVWMCECDCGTRRPVRGSRLRAGKSMSCGCYHRDRVTTHGQSHDGKGSTYMVWKSILLRCYSTGNRSFRHYGGRGIAVCDRWRESFQNFLADMGPRPTAKHSIDRRDSDGNYEPSNCRWATAAEQSANRRGVKLTPELADEIRRLYASGSLQRELSERFGVSGPTVSLIVSGKTWISQPMAAPPTADSASSRSRPA